MVLVVHDSFLNGFAKPWLSVNLNLSTEALAQADSIQILHYSLKLVSGDSESSLSRSVGVQDSKPFKRTKTSMF